MIGQVEEAHFATLSMLPKRHDPSADRPDNRLETLIVNPELVPR